MQIRSVKNIIQPITVMEGAGVKVRRTIGSNRIDHLDPFLLLDHFESDNPADYIAGFPMHPHRGIETVTYLLSGEVRHKDSLGNSGSIRSGDAQWMTSGRGIMHEEMPKPVDGKMAGFQLWVNLPAKNKMDAPKYQDVPASKIPKFVTQSGIEIKVITGKFDDIVGPVTGITTNPSYWDVFIPPETEFEAKIAVGHAVFAYLYKGESIFGDRPVSGTNLIVFSDGDTVKVKTGSKSARFLLVSGKPINEPIARYGPFVMNTQAEIKQTLTELRNGTFVR